MWDDNFTNLRGGMLASLLEDFDLDIYNTGAAIHYHIQTDTVSMLSLSYAPLMLFFISCGLSPRICVEVNTIFSYCLFPRATLLPMFNVGAWTGLTGLTFRYRQRLVDWFQTFQTSKGLLSIFLPSSEGLVNVSSLALEET